MRWTTTSGVLCLALPLLFLWGTSVGPGRAAAVEQETAAQKTTVEDWKKTLGNMTDGAWITSNHAYQTEDGGIERYGLDLELQPGGLAASGCLWGEPAGGEPAVFWRFFEAWDPVREAGFVYQSHSAGLVAFGYLEDRGPDEPQLTQDLRLPDGTINKTGHFETWEGTDTHVTRSVDFVEGEWATGRTYSWTRDRDRRSPC